MKQFLSFALIVGVAWSIGGCMKKLDDGKIPVTTSSENARREFLQGRKRAEKLDLTNSSHHFDKAIELDSTFATAYLNRANVSFTAKEFFDNLKKAVAQAGSASEGDRLVILAAEAGANGNVTKQKENLAKMVELFPDDERAHFNYGTYFFGQQEYAQAIAEKNNDVGSMSSDIAMKANILLNMGKNHEALAAFERSAQLITTSNLSQQVKESTKLFQHCNNARVAIARQDLTTAKAETEEFGKGTEANRNSNQIRLVHELAGSIALAEKKSDVAIAELLQSNQQDPYDLYRIAVAYQMKGDKVQAKEFCKKAVHFNGLPQLNYAFVRSKAEQLLATM